MKPKLSNYHQGLIDKHVAEHGCEPEWTEGARRINGAPSKRGSKMGNRKVVTEEGTFDSGREYARWCELKFMVMSKDITELQRQVKYPLEAGGISFGWYVADFVYRDSKTGDIVVEDSKGFRTQKYIKSRRLMREIHGIVILET